MNSLIFSIILFYSLDFCLTGISDNEGVPLQPDSNSESDLVPQFEETLVNTRSLHMSWSIPYFPLRILLLYRHAGENMNIIQLGSGSRNYTIESLEPGTSYEVILQVFFSSADMHHIRKILTTVPVLPSQNTEESNILACYANSTKNKFVYKGKVKAEVQFVLKKDGWTTKTLTETMLYRDKGTSQDVNVKNQMKSLVGDFDFVEDIYIYSLREDADRFYMVSYMTLLQPNKGYTVFYRIHDNLQTLNVNKLGFGFAIFGDCCKPLYYHHLNSHSEWNKKDILNLKIIPTNTAFTPGKCGQSLDMIKGDISVQTHGEKSLKAITIALYIKLNKVSGLHPVMSAINYHTQLRLEVQQGKLVWMFYNIRNAQGFIVSTETVFAQDQWTHILVDYNSGSGLGRVFVDGILQTKTLSHVNLHNNWMLGLRIGKYYSGGLDYKMNGFIDELYIFGCVLTLEQIEKLATSCDMFTCDPTNRKSSGPKVFVTEDNGKVNNKKNDLVVHYIGIPHGNGTSHSVDVKVQVIKKTSENKLSSKCNIAGTKTGPKSSQCQCKKNVVGTYCDQCKNGTFNLDENNIDGCISCFCNGLTKSCRSAKIQRNQIILNAQDIQNLNLRTISNKQVGKIDLLYNPITSSISFKSFDTLVTTSDIYYWELPLRYCGDKVASYGGNLRYTISYLSKPLDKPLYTQDVILKGNGYHLYYTEDKDPLPGQQHHYQIILEERFWQHKNGNPVKREEMISALAGIEAFLLRATFSTEMIETSLYEVRLDVASYNPLSSNTDVASMVEECNCPPAYFGTSCQHCNKGYRKVKNSLLLGRCVKCSCNGHADDCDGVTGECRSCNHFTTGVHCEKCLPGYYGDPRSGRPDACRPCPCPLTIASNQFSSSCKLDTDGQATCLDCQPGYSGRNCEFCVSPYVGDPIKPGDSCKLPKDSKCEDCDRRGSIDSTCDPATGNCVCKKNVEGRKCSSCKQGSFNLDVSNKDGCLSCWCFGVSTRCESARLYRKTITMKDFEGTIRVTDFGYQLNIQLTYIAKKMKELILPKVNKLPKSTLYWSLPKRYLGNKLNSYGGLLKYKLSYDALSIGKPYLATDIKVIGQNGLSVIFSSKEKIRKQEIKEISVQIREDFWTSDSGLPISRSDLMFILANVKAILIRAIYSTATTETLLYKLEMSDAVPFNMYEGETKHIEMCQCPKGYKGSSCQLCDQGYTRFIENGQPKCRKCECYGHTIECHPETGKCIRCQHHTQGDHCDKCQDGYYGDAKTGQCKQCACPLLIRTNQFSPTCVLTDDGSDYSCDACQQGYDGQYCGECANGYTGNPLTPGGTCKKHAQRYNPVPSVEITPLRRHDRIGTTATFVCTVHGSDPLKIVWSRVDGRPFPKRVKISTKSKNVKVLTIRKLQMSDAETYICSGRNDFGVDTVKSALTVIGYRLDPIRVTVTPKSMRIEQGATARFLCDHTSEATSEIKWSRDGSRDLPPEAVAHNGVLTIANIQRRHSGLYTCTGSNQYSTDKVNVQILVGVVVSPEVSIRPSYQTVDIDSTVTFRCSINGYPLPKITWKRGQGKPFPNRAQIHDGILTIIDTREDDEGDYLCSATNRGGSVTRKAALYIRGQTSLPTINVTPSNIRIKPGLPVSFSCTTNDPNAKIIWVRRNGRLSLESSVENGVLRIPAVRDEDQGAYVCSVTNTYGSVQKTAEIFVLSESGIKPVVNLSPKFSTAIEGKYLSIKCNVSGIPPPTVLWSRPGGLLSDDHIVYENELQIFNIKAGDSGTYVCSGENVFGSDSATAVISVERRVLPVISIRSSNKIAYAGAKISFMCKLTAGYPKPIVFWQTSNGYRVPSSYVKELQNGVALNFEELKRPHSGKYVCVALNIAGRVERTVSLSVRGDPRVVLKPRGLHQVAYKDKVVFECFAYGYPIPAVAMTFPAGFNSTNPYIKTNITLGYLRVEFEADFHLSGAYSCEGVNSLGSKQDWVHLKVNPRDTLPVVNIMPSEASVLEQSSVRLFCNAKGVPDPKIHWTKDSSTEIISNQPLVYFDVIQSKDGGVYHCHAVNRRGSSRVSANLEVIIPPKATIVPEQTVVKKGYAFNLKCVVDGNPKPSIEWKKLGDEDFLSSPSLLLYGDELVVTSAKTNHAGQYMCVVKNIHGTSIVKASVAIVEPPTLSSHNNTVIRVNLIDTIKLHCDADGYPTPAIKWLLPPSTRSSHVVKRGLLEIRNISKHEQGQYKCQASNVGGVLEETFTILVKQIPKVYIDVPYEEIQVLAGTQKSLFCYGKGAPAPKLTWSRVGDQLLHDVHVVDGALHFSSVKFNHSGTYRCLGKNPYGSVLAEVKINVEGAPIVKVSPSILNIDYGEQAKFYCSATGSKQSKITWSKLNGKLPIVRYIKRDYMLIPKVSDKDGGTYVCRAENQGGVGEAAVQLNVLEFIPKFNSSRKSMLIFQPIKKTLYYTKIQISFKPLSLNGLLLYCGRHNKDFISVSIKKGFVIFQFDLGSGQANIRSKRAIKLNDWFSVTVVRDGAIGSLKLDKDDVVYGKSPGRFTGLNLDSEVFLGGHEDFPKISKQIQLQKGFDGCVSQLVIDGKKLHFIQSSIQLHKISACKSCRDENPCLNNAKCLPGYTKYGVTCDCPVTHTGRFCEERVERCYPGVCGKEGVCRNKKKNGLICQCFLGRFGKYCEKGHRILIPSFQQTSFMKYSLPATTSSALTISMSFKLWSQNQAEIFTTSHYFRNKQIYLNLSIRDGYVVLTYDLGDGPVVIKSSVMIKVDEWTRVYVEQRQRFGSMSINGGQAFKNSSRGYRKSLHLNSKSTFTLGSEEKLKNGFFGCIRDLTINSKTLKLDQDFLKTHQISSCYKYTSSCVTRPCLHNSTCIIVSKDLFKCHCIEGYEGKRCEKKIEKCGTYPKCQNGGVCMKRKSSEMFCLCSLGFSGTSCEIVSNIGSSVSMNDESYLIYPKTLIKRVEQTSIKLSLQTIQSDGLLFWHGHDIKVTPDFLSIGLKDGQLEIQFELGSGLAEVTSNTRLNDGDWHHIKVIRNGSFLTATIDETEALEVKSEGKNRNLDVYAIFYIGGASDIPKITRKKYSQSFIGCLKDLEIENKKLDFQNMPSNGYNLQPCDDDTK